MPSDECISSMMGDPGDWSEHNKKRNMKDSTKLSLSACLLGKHNEELNIAICEWLGWKFSHTNVQKDDVYYTPERGLYVYPLPSHILGLTALGNMALAEEKLIGPHKTRYTSNLFNLPCDPVFASALHRCIALLQTVNPEMFIK